MDAGALINAGAGLRARAVDLARVDPLRVFRQRAAVRRAPHPGRRQGRRHLEEFPGQKFTGVVARTAEAIDPDTRTLLTKWTCPNKDGRLLPGSFGEVHFTVASGDGQGDDPGEHHAVPGRRAAGGGGWAGTARWCSEPITIGRDYGTTLEILAGVTPQDRIIVNPSDSLEEGQQVTVGQGSESALQCTDTCTPFPAGRGRRMNSTSGMVSMNRQPSR